MSSEISNSAVAYQQHIQPDGTGQMQLPFGEGFSRPSASSGESLILSTDGYDLEEELATILNEVSPRLPMSTQQEMTNGAVRSFTITEESLQRSITLWDMFLDVLEATDSDNDIEDEESDDDDEREFFEDDTVNVDVPPIPELFRETAFIAVDMTAAQEETFIEQVVNERPIFQYYENDDSDKTILTNVYDILDFVKTLGEGGGPEYYGRLTWRSTCLQSYLNSGQYNTTNTRICMPQHTRQATELILKWSIP
ncbi:1572_t:CDS:2 [Ambispora leptoticha]|uniref:1572_t:CDS:1 n=1 Tax=Ambispora leptoticha TaxID=144679 RepID=A0A9N8WQR7_9GLOM|nr:1572_t:CDS:2 [Ambispora leptoticha]